MPNSNSEPSTIKRLLQKMDYVFLQSLLLGFVMCALSTWGKALDNHVVTADQHFVIFSITVWMWMCVGYLYYTYILIKEDEGRFIELTKRVATLESDQQGIQSNLKAITRDLIRAQARAVPHHWFLPVRLLGSDEEYVPSRDPHFLVIFDLITNEARISPFDLPTSGCAPFGLAFGGLLTMKVSAASSASPSAGFVFAFENQPGSANGDKVLLPNVKSGDAFAVGDIYLVVTRDVMTAYDKVTKTQSASLAWLSALQPRP